MNKGREERREGAGEGGKGEGLQGGEVIAVEIEDLQVSEVGQVSDVLQAGQVTVIQVQLQQRVCIDVIKSNLTII